MDRRAGLADHAVEARKELMMLHSPPGLTGVARDEERVGSTSTIIIPEWQLAALQIRARPAGRRCEGGQSCIQLRHSPGKISIESCL